MENNFIYHSSLPDISLLTQNRIASIDSLINNLKIIDVKDDIAFENTTSKIKNKILFEPLTIEEPKLLDYSFNNANYTHMIVFPFSGNRELFLHSYNGMSFSLSDHGVIEPSNNELKVYVTLSELNPTEAIIQAQSLIKLTKKIGEANSQSIMEWNLAVERRIDDDLKNKRIQLIELFA